VKRSEKKIILPKAGSAAALPGKIIHFDNELSGIRKHPAKKM